ncbi:cell division protein FtsN [Rahnella variigena]|uniref:Cell division protein FtsN n=1 Tax=Rahnella variigena TaxID=574964 RepID=A0ABX9PRC6_9GAMM|nr:cell division protein FtsN [Rahnella variigena]RJT49920.1 cell division protein FtsN [Rahnella variigena]RKF67598.1 cell division protein FtsN [Rahnella variigena]
MAQRDYVSRGRSGARRKSTSRSKKRSSPTISKTMVVLAVAVLVVFVGGLYFIAHNKHEEAVVLPTHPVRPGNGLPPKPEERWRYIKELENRQMGVTTPTEPTAGGQVESKTQLTPEQRQLLEQMQADMRQTPTQLSEVPYNDPNQATQTRTAPAQRQVQQQQPTYAQQQPVQTQPRQVQPTYTPQTQPVRAPQAQVQTQAVQPKPKPQVKEPVKEVPKEVAKPQQPAAITQVAPEKPKAQEKTQHFVVQCGSFKGSEQAESQRAKLAFEGFEGRITTGGGWSRVVIGPYNSRSGADSTLSRLKGAGISGCIPVATGG